jgi:Ca2+-binding RTX toxin-like protein
MTAAGVQALERRTLFAAGATLEAGGVLFVQGLAKDDRVALFQDAAGARILAKVNGVTQSFASTDVAKIVIDTKRGNDLVEILSSIGGVIERPVTVWTHAGNDTIIGGDGPERLNAGDDDDIVSGGGGRDTIYGGPGPGADILRGGGASDVINGEDGADTIRGDAGNDNLYGGANADNLRGNLGNDVLRGGGGNDYLNGDEGDDQLFGENGIDALDGAAGRDTLRGGAAMDVIYFTSSDQDDIDSAERFAGEIVDLSPA